MIKVVATASVFLTFFLSMFVLDYDFWKEKIKKPKEGIAFAQDNATQLKEPVWFADTIKDIKKSANKVEGFIKSHRLATLPVLRNHYFKEINEEHHYLKELIALFNNEIKIRNKPPNEDIQKILREANEKVKTVNAKFGTTP